MTTQQKTFTYPPIDASMDELLLSNPDRGFRMEVFVNVANRPILDFPCHDDPAVGLKYWHTFYRPEQPRLAQIYFYLTGYRDGSQIDENGLERIRANFVAARSLGVKLLVRFTYQTHVEESRGQASQNTILTHLTQLAPMLRQYADVIHVVQSGMIGAWGEWHNYTKEYDRAGLIRALAGIVPEQLYLQMRLPIYKNLIDKQDPLYSRLGFHIDSVFGETRPDTGDCDPGTEQWEQLMDESYVTPVDGELFWGATCPWEIDGKKVLCQLSDHHFTSFSLHHSYRENQIADEMRDDLLYWADKPETKQRVYAMQRWQKEPVTEGWLKEQHCLVAPGWFSDKDGSAVNRSVYEYIRDYLGYKLELGRCTMVLQRLESEQGGQMQLSIQTTIRNYGFSAPFNLTAEILLLDPSGNAAAKGVLTAPACTGGCIHGKSDGWYSRKRTDMGETEPVTHQLAATLFIPNVASNYLVGLRLSNDAGSCARIGNQMLFQNGCHILGQLKNGCLSAC